MHLRTDVYLHLNASALSDDPFVQEWIFYPLSDVSNFFTGLVNQNAGWANHLHSARERLLGPGNNCRITTAARDQYKQLKRRLQTEKKTEAAYMIVEGMYEEWRSQAKQQSFSVPSHEQHFNKVILPLFGQERVALQLRYQSGLFGEENNFRERESWRMNRLRSREAKLIAAYVNGDTTNDEEWYRMSGDQEARGPEVISQYLGLIRYLHYLKTSEVSAFE